MNNETLLLSVLRESREYKALTDALGAAKRQASPRPFAVTGLSEGASPLLLCALAGDTVASGERVLILFSSEKDAADTAALLGAQGISACHYPARDYNFNIATPSREWEHRRLSVLSRLLFTEEPMAICATAEAALQMAHIRVRGLMTIPPADSDRETNMRYFQEIRALFVDINEKMFHNELKCLSMGMSGDFEDAIRSGATMVRVGTAIFGARHYPT